MRDHVYRPLGDHSLLPSLTPVSIYRFTRHKAFSPPTKSCPQCPKVSRSKNTTPFRHASTKLQDTNPRRPSSIYLQYAYSALHCYTRWHSHPKCLLSMWSLSVPLAARISTAANKLLAWNFILRTSKEKCRQNRNLFQTRKKISGTSHVDLSTFCRCQRY
jgi:hypothetical protein